MEWAHWKPIYLDILADFGFDARADVRSATVLAKLVENRRMMNFSTIVDYLGSRVLICGAAASLEHELSRMSSDDTLISAGSATGRMMRQGIMPDIIVSDLDGDVQYEIEASSKGALTFVHAHADNVESIEHYVPMLKGPVIPTVQCQPFGIVYNFGGFTDGDRAYMITRHFGVENIRMIGWDFDRPFPKEGSDLFIKKKKLIWAKKLICDY